MIAAIRRWAATAGVLATDHDRRVEHLEAENQRLRTQLGMVTHESAVTHEAQRIELAAATARADEAEAELRKRDLGEERTAGLVRTIERQGRQIQELQGENRLLHQKWCAAEPLEVP